MSSFCLIFFRGKGREEEHGWARPSHRPGDKSASTTTIFSEVKPKIESTYADSDPQVSSAAASPAKCDPCRAKGRAEVASITAKWLHEGELRATKMTHTVAGHQTLEINGIECEE